MARTLRAWAINRGGKNLVRNLQYGPRTRLVRGMSTFISECVFCFVLYFPSHAVSDMFFSISFLTLEILKKCVQRRVTIPQGQQHISSVQQS